MDQCKAFYVAVTNACTWGKGKTLLEAIANAKYKKFEKPKEYSTKSPQIYVTQFLLREDTPDDIAENLQKCYNVDGFGGVRFYEGGDKAERERDLQQVEQYIMGTCWINND
jgi:hypothetical protein